MYFKIKEIIYWWERQLINQTNKDMRPSCTIYHIVTLPRFGELARYWTLRETKIWRVGKIYLNLDYLTISSCGLTELKHKEAVQESLLYLEIYYWETSILDAIGHWPLKETLHPVVLLVLFLLIPGEPHEF